MDEAQRYQLYQSGLRFVAVCGLRVVGAVPQIAYGAVVRVDETQQYRLIGLKGEI